MSEDTTRPTCKGCEESIGPKEDYTIVEEGSKNGIIKAYYHEKCMKEQRHLLTLDASTRLSEILQEHNEITVPFKCTACGGDITEGYVAITFVGKTWSVKRYFDIKCVGKFVEDHLEESVENWS